jgi:hypothetical protein
VCVNGTCTNGATCFDTHTAQDSVGNKTACDPFGCSGGACLHQCESLQDCVAPNVCDPSGHCVAPPSNRESSGGCSAAPTRDGAGSMFAWLAVVAAAAIAWGRRGARAAR